MKTLVKNFWKQSTAWVIGSKNKLFRSARVKLTLFYFLVTAVIICLFSAAFYFTLSAYYGENLGNEKKIESKDQRAFDKTVEKIQKQTLVETDQRLIKYIMLIDGAFLLFATALSYFLSARTLRPIEKALEQQKQFSANASHELRTPLAIMKTDFEVTLRNRKLKLEDYQAVIKSNLEEVERMSKIVNSILKLSRGDNTANDATESLVEIDRLVLKIIAKLTLLAKNKNIILFTSNINQATIKGNIDDFYDILINLIQNAINYTPENGKIEVALIKKEKGVELTISDTGIGISAKDLPHIFERFYKVDQARTQGVSGAGLGLSLVAELVKKQHGEIFIKSKLQQGTKVTLRFPLMDMFIKSSSLSDTLN